MKQEVHRIEMNAMLADIKARNLAEISKLKASFRKSPITETRISELKNYGSNEKLLKKYGKKDVDEALELSKSSEANADYVGLLFYRYIKKDEEFKMENLLNYLRAYNKGQSRKFIIGLVNEMRKSPISEDEKKNIEGFLRMAYLKKDEGAHCYAEQEILSYLNKRDRMIKDKDYSEIESFRNKMELLRDW